MGCGCGRATRRSFLYLAGASAVPLLAGCDEGGFKIVPDATVERLGLQAWEDMRRQMPASGDADLQSALAGVAGRLLSAAGEEPSNWEAVVFASPEVNAFALPGNKIGVFEGMFRVFANPDQLAAVVGHEIGHLQAEHSQERMTAQIPKDLGLRVVALILQLSEVEFAADIAAALGIGVEYGLVLPYSRRQELEADALGVQLMDAAGFAPAEAAALWRRMAEVAGPRLPDFLATHPDPEARIEAIEAMLPELGA